MPQSNGSDGQVHQRPLDRHLEAQRVAFGPDAYRPARGTLYRWAITCPRCASGCAVTVHEVGIGGALAFTRCTEGCTAGQVIESAGELERFWLDGHDSILLPLQHNPVEGWLVAMPVEEFASLLREAS